MRNTSLMRKFWLSVGLSSLSTLGMPWGVVVGLLGTTSVTTLITTLSVTAPLQAAVLSSWEFDPTRQELEIIVPGGTTPQYSLVAEPARIIVDLPGTDLGTVPVQQTYGGAIREIRVGQFEPGLTRIVLELAPGTVLAPGHVELRRVGEGSTSDGQPGDRWVVRPLVATDMPIANASPESPSAASPEPNTAIDPSAPADSNSPLVDSASDTHAADELPPLEPGALEIPVQMPPADAIASSTPESDLTESEDQPTENQTEEEQSEENQSEENQSAGNSTPEETEPPVPAVDSVAEVSPDLDSSDADSSEPDSPDAMNTPDSVPDVMPDAAQSAEVDDEGEPSDLATPETPETTEAPVAIAPAPTEDPIPSEDPIPATETTPETSAVIEPAQPAPATSAPMATPEGLLPSLPSPGSTESNAVVSVPPLDAAPDNAPGSTDAERPDRTAPDMVAAETEPSDAPSSDPLSETPASPSAPSTIAPFPTPTITTPPSSVSASPVPPSELAVEANPVEANPAEANPAEANSNPSTSSVPTAPSAPSAASAPIQTVPPMLATAPPTTPTPTPVNSVPSIAFGQPLPSASSHGAAAPEIMLPPSNHSPESILLPSGTVLSLRYPGESPLELAEGQPRQEVLVLAEAVQDQAGNTILPEGTYVIGRFETKTDGSQFIAQAISVQGQTLFLNAQSETISGDRNSNNILRNSALGVAAGAVLGGLTGIGLIPAIAAGAATSAATTYVTAPNAAIIQPDQVVEVQLIEDLLRINATGIGG